MCLRCMWQLHSLLRHGSPSWLPHYDMQIFQNLQKNHKSGPLILVNISNKGFLKLLIGVQGQQLLVSRGVLDPRDYSILFGWSKWTLGHCYCRDLVSELQLRGFTVASQSGEFWTETWRLAHTMGKACASQEEQDLWEHKGMSERCWGCEGL